MLALRACLVRGGSAPALAVAYSGGADSTALLLAVHQHWGGPVIALHVNHGLQAAAAAFEAHCQSRCAALGLALMVARPEAGARRGESPEDAARRARYHALAEMATRAGIAHVALAQHADDQAETVLLALSRGAGMPGLAAMPQQFVRHGSNFHRPILNVSADAIRQWLREQQEPWVDDPSNAHHGHTRNRIRHVVMPPLEQAFPTIRVALARTARHAAAASRLLAVLAQQDLQHAGVPPDIAALRALDAERMANALRYWLSHHCATACSTAQMDELVRQVQACRTRGHRIALRVGSGMVLRQGPKLTWQGPPQAADRHFGCDAVANS